MAVDLFVGQKRQLRHFQCSIVSGSCESSLKIPSWKQERKPTATRPTPFLNYSTGNNVCALAAIIECESNRRLLAVHINSVTAAGSVPELSKFDSSLISVVDV